MARRDYVSFLGERRRDITFGDRGRDPTVWVLLVTAVATMAISVWWFGFRDVDGVIASERILNETTVPTLLTPSALEGRGAGSDDIDLSCPALIEEWTTFQGSADRTGCVSTPLIVKPEIMWATEIGILGWRNNPVIADGAVFVGSAGVLQSGPDRFDGIYSIDLRTGQQRWFYTTELDVNSVAVSDGIVIATGDEGRVWALSARDGRLLWTDDLGISVFADPLIIDDLVIVGDGNGIIRAYPIDLPLDGGDPVWTQTVTGAIRGGLAWDGEHIYAAGESGELLVLSINGQIVWRKSVQARIPGATNAEIWGAPTVTDTMVIIALKRADLFADPALIALDKVDGEELWRARDAAGLKPSQWANIRSSPAVVGDYLVLGEAYSQDLVVLDLSTGETLWSTTTGEYCFPHWPSVAINSGADQAQAILSRQDGGLYAVDLATREVAWSIYLGDADGTGAFPANFKEGGFCQWGPTDGYSILSSPAISPEGVVVVGSSEGFLLAIGDADWEN